MHTGLKEQKNETIGPGRTGVGNLAADRSGETDQEEDEMKAFNKWLAKEHSLSNDNQMVDEKHYHWREREEWASDAWRAALEWTLSVSESCGDWWMAKICEELEGS